MGLPHTLQQKKKNKKHRVCKAMYLRLERECERKAWKKKRNSEKAEEQLKKCPTWWKP